MASNENTAGTGAAASKATSTGAENQVVGKVFIIYGAVKAVAPDGTVRALAPNSPIFAHDKIVTESDGSVSVMIDGLDGAPATQLDLGRMSSVTIDEDVYAGTSPGVTADATADAEKIQQALESGEDIQMDATAAGGDTGAGGGMHVFNLAATGGVIDVTSGAGSTGPLGGTIAGQQTTVTGAPVDIPTVALTHDTGISSSDFLTNNASVTVSAPAAGVTRTYTVDGTTSSSYTAPTTDGSHTVVVTDTNTSGNTASSGITFTLDTHIAAPTASLVHDTGISAADHITNDASLLFSAPAETVMRTFTVDGGTPTTNLAAALADGQHSVVVTDVDAAGNTASGTITFTLDTSISTPTMALTTDSGSSATDLITNNAALTLSAAAADVTRTYTIDGTASTTYNPAALADGQHTIVVTDTDTAGNTASSTFAFTLDTTAPVVGITVAPITADNIINAAEAGGNIAVTGTLNGEVQVGNTVTLTVNGHAYTGTVAVGNTFNISVAGSDLAVDHTINASVTTTDVAGNTGTAAMAHAYGVDITAPIASITVAAITADNTINIAEAGGNVAVTGTVGGDVQVGDHVTLTVHGANYSGTVLEGKTFSIDVKGSDLAADSNVHATVSTTDAAGNSITVAADHPYGVDTTPPSPNITLDAHIAVDNVINLAESQHDVPINGTVGGDVKVGDTVTLTINGHIYTGSVQTGNTFSINVAGSDLVADSDHTIDASVTTVDAAGNSATATAHAPYGIDITPPIANITVDSVTPDNVVNIAEAGGNVAITGTVGGDVQVGDHVTLTVHAANYTGLVQSGNTFSIDVKGSDLAADSNVHATVTTTDAAGNSTTVAADHGYGVDTMNPMLTVVVANGLLSDVHNSTAVTFTFSEAPVGFTESDINVSAGLTLNSGSLTMIDATHYQATVTAADGFTGTGTVSVAAGTYTDVALNVGGTGSDTVAIDTLNPTVTVDVADGLLSDAHNSASVTFTFSEAPVNFVLGDISAQHGVVTNLQATSNPLVYTATYTAADGYTGADTIAVAASSYTDAAGNLGSADSHAVAIDTLAPVPHDDTIAVQEGASQITGKVTLSDDAHVVAGTFDNGGLGGHLVLNTDGSYSYTAPAYVDHDAPLQNGAEVAKSEGFTYTLVDASGNESQATLHVNIGDTFPTLGGGGDINLSFVTEHAGYNNVIGTYELGADGHPTNMHILIPNTNTAAPGDLGTIAADAKIFIIANGANESYHVGDPIAFDPNNHNVYYMDKAFNADHADHFKDGSGNVIDAVPVNGEIHIEDMPVGTMTGHGDADYNDIVLHAAQAPTVSEANLLDGTSPDTAALTVEGNLYDHQIIPSADPLMLQVGEKSLVLDGSNQSIFVDSSTGHLTISANGHWSYTLVDNTLAHQDTNSGVTDGVGSDGDSDRGAADQVQDVFNLKVTDIDGDSMAPKLIININDDGPVAHIQAGGTIHDVQTETLFAYDPSLVTGNHVLDAPGDHWGQTSGQNVHAIGTNGLEITDHGSGEAQATATSTPTFNVAAGSSASISFDVNILAETQNTHTHDGHTSTDHFTWTLYESHDGDWNQIHSQDMTADQNNVNYSWNQGDHDGTYRLVFEAHDVTGGSEKFTVQIDDIKVTATTHEIEGSLLTGGGFGADGGHVLSVAALHDGQPVTGEGHSDTAKSATDDLTVKGEFGGTLHVDSQGDYIYTPPEEGGKGHAETFSFTLIDGDGDTASAQLSMLIDDPNQPKTC